MTFNEHVFAVLGVIFQKNGLHIFEQRHNYVQVKSKYVIISLAYNPMENSNTFWIKRNSKGSDEIEVQNEVMKDFFHSDLKVSLCTTNEFLENLKMFFEKEGKPLLEGDLLKMLELEKYHDESTHLYNVLLKVQQNQNAADKAWLEKDYNTFIKYMDKIDIKYLAPSYKLKYDIAQRKKQ